MAQRKKAPARKPTAVPEGYKPFDTRPAQLVFEPGDEFEGTLGAVAKSKDGNMPDYRTMTVDGKRFYVPSHAALRGLLDLPVGAQVWLRFDGGDGTKEAPYEWSVGVRESDAPPF